MYSDNLLLLKLVGEGYSEYGRADAALHHVLLADVVVKRDSKSLAAAAIGQCKDVFTS